MFGLVTASMDELSPEEKRRYTACYCGICRRIREEASPACRLGLSYDMAFLALLLGSLYEVPEREGNDACLPHPVRKRPWVDSEVITYAADMNVALAYYNCLDDWQDDRKLSARAMAGVFGRHMEKIREKYPRQCAAMDGGIRRLRALEAAGCPDPDQPAGCFGELMAELLVLREDLWAPTLREMGFALGRFIYLADAVLDLEKDKKRHDYNPLLAHGEGEDPRAWEKYLVLAMAKCTECFERLPLVQDKGILDNILYSGVWINYNRRGRNRREGKQ